MAEYVCTALPVGAKKGGKRGRGRTPEAAERAARAAFRQHYGTTHCKVTTPRPSRKGARRKGGSTAEVDARLKRLEERVVRVEARCASINARLGAIEKSLGQLGAIQTSLTRLLRIADPTGRST